GAIHGGGMTADSLQRVGYPHDTLMLEVASSATSVCSGEEVHYGIVRQAHIDSVVWYVNDQIVLSGKVRETPTYTYRPAAGDRVWAVGYNTGGHCVHNNGLASEELSVEVTSIGTPGIVIATLTSSADSVCGAGAPVYTVTGRGFDSVYWYANGQLEAITDLLETGVRAVPVNRTAMWKRAPRPASEGPDSVYAVAVRRAKVCALRNEQTTNVVSVLRRERPEVRITPRDTSVLTGHDLILEGAGASAYVWWTDAEHGIAGTMQTFTLIGHGDTVMVYTMGYEPAFNRDSLAGGRTPAPEANAYDEFTCLAFDSVLVRPDEIPVLDSSVIFIPNAVLRHSARPADRVFRVYGENIASVHMRIFNNNGDLIFEKTDANPVWKATDVQAGNFTYRIVITLQDGKTINKNGWVSVLE
ncbi:MAG: gliding motility-associated C-terminal domain-containing protein, partial [Bacteroidales bacterium]|nr:gliding motility-associated C-terminal domain-containing protein [Bacteroidales bacterium]